MQRDTCFAVFLAMHVVCFCGHSAERPFEHFGTAYYPEDRSPEKWSDDLSEMVRVGVDTVRIGEFNWSGFEPREGEFDFRSYRRFLDLCQSKGIGVMMCTPTAAMPRWLARKYPEVRKLRTDGSRPPSGHRLDYCASSPRYRELSRRIVSRLAEAFRDHPAIYAWQIDNEIHPRAGTGLCMCRECEKGLQGSLRRRYGSIENLNRALHGSFWSCIFNDWDEITLPLDDRNAWTREYLRYQDENFISFACEQRDILRETNPKWMLTANTWGCLEEFRRDELCRNFDCVSVDTYIRNDEYINLWRWQMSCYRGLSGRQQKFMIGEIGPFRLDGSSPHSYDAVKCWCWELAARGAESIFFFCWNTSVSGEEQSVRILPWSERKGRAYETVKSFHRDISSLPVPLARLPLERSQVAILHDAEAVQYHSMDGAFFNECFWKVNARLHVACERFGITPEVVQLAEDMDLSPYRIVFLPSCERWKERSIRALRDFVSRGGIAVALTHLNYITEGGAYVTEPWPVGMTDLFGLEVVEQRRLYGAGARPASVPLTFGGGRFSAEGYVESARTSTAKVLERYSSTCYSGDPLLTCNCYKKGKAWYLTSQADQEGIKTVVKRILSEAGVSQDRELPLSIARIMRGPYVVLTNYADESVRVPLETGTLIFGSATEAGDGMVTLPPFGVLVFLK